MTIQEIVAALNKGQTDDIWYDAQAFDDVDSQKKIDDALQAMQEAALLIPIMFAALEEVDAILPIHHSDLKTLEAHRTIRAAIAKSKGR